MDNKKVIFCGTPKISVECLKALLDVGIKPELVITQPDRYIGRKKEIIFSPIKEFCIKNNINFSQPEKISSIEEIIQKIQPDLLITCAYGQFIPESILKIPKYYSINIHASLLPKHRGGAPIHWAIIRGDKKSGITIMEMVKKMDSGDIFFQEEIDILENDTLDTMFEKMEELAYKVTKKYINCFFEKNLKKQKQDEDLVSFSYNIKREDEQIDFNQSSNDVFNLIRGLCSIPGSFFKYNNKIVKVFSSQKTNCESTKIPGTIIEINDLGLVVSTKTNNIILTSIKIEGKNIVKGVEIKNYHNFFKINTMIIKE